MKERLVMKRILTKFTIGFFMLMSQFIYPDCYEKLPSEFQVTYGKDDAQVTVIYLYSIYCPSCLEFMRDEFPKLKEKYIDSGYVKWNWHPFPNPHRPLTYQAMICLQRLSETQKKIFLEHCANNLGEENMDRAVELFKKLMDFFGFSKLPDFYSKEFLLDPHAKACAAKFISQKKEISIPSIEINGTYFSSFPTLEFIETQITTALEEQGVHL